MACSDTNPKRVLKSTALKKLNDTFQGFVESLEEEISFNSVVHVAVNHDQKKELTYQLKIVENLVKSIREQVLDIQECLTECDEILGLACGNPPSQEDVMRAPRTGSDVGVGGASNPHAESKAVSELETLRPRRRGNTCRHYCSHHQEVMDHTLWGKLPREMVQHICAFLPFSKLVELQKICTSLRQWCAKTHDDLFGVLMDNNYHSYRLAVSNSMHTEWSNLEIKDMHYYGRPNEYFGKKLFAHNGGLVCILPYFFERFESQQSPHIIVFNPLTGDRRDIPLSSLTCSKDKNDTQATLLQLIVDSGTGYYELILVTQNGRYDTKRKVYSSERYDSKSKLWSTLDCGFIFGDGVVNYERREVYFDCCSKQLCTFDGQPLVDGALLKSNHCLTIMRDHEFEIEYTHDVGDDHDCRLLKILEKVWDNRWITRSITPISIKKRQNYLISRLFACQRYLLVVAKDVSIVEHRRQLMLLFDTKTRKAYDIPNFWRKDDLKDGGAEFLNRKVHVMCDLKWNVVP